MSLQLSSPQRRSFARVSDHPPPRREMSMHFFDSSERPSALPLSGWPQYVDTSLEWSFFGQIASTLQTGEMFRHGASG